MAVLLSIFAGLLEKSNPSTGRFTPQRLLSRGFLLSSLLRHELRNRPHEDKIRLVTRLLLPCCLPVVKTGRRNLQNRPREDHIRIGPKRRWRYPQSRAARRGGASSGRRRSCVQNRAREGILRLIQSHFSDDFLKVHRKVEQLEKQIEALTAGLHKVSAQLEVRKASPAKGCERSVRVFAAANCWKSEA